jgi:hypothetical protein
MTGIHEYWYFPEKKKYAVDYVFDWSTKVVELCGLGCLPFPFSSAPLVFAVPLFPCLVTWPVGLCCAWFLLFTSPPL